MKTRPSIMNKTLTTIGCLLGLFSGIAQSSSEVKQAFDNQTSLQISTEFGAFSTQLTKQDNSTELQYYFGNLQGQKGDVTINVHNNKLVAEIALENYTIVVQDTDQGRIANKFHNNGIHCHFEKPKEKKERVINEETLPVGIDVNKLESNSSAEYVIYIDMDGEEVTDPHWLNQSNTENLENGKGIVLDPNLSDQKKYEIWQMVSEDYQAFNVNVTTNRAIFDSKNYDKSQMVIIGAEKNDWLKFSNAGVARVGGFSVSNSPCFGFTGGVGNGVKNLGEVASHELGHTFGLLHDGINSSGYYEGHGDWAPIMGVAYYKAVSQWSKCEYQDGSDESFPFSGVNQDDVQMIANVLGFKIDDHANTIDKATLLVPTGNIIDASNNMGIIETANDLDCFQFSTTGGNINLDFIGARPAGNLDIEVKLLNAQGGVINTYNTANELNTSINTNLAAGTYYLQIDGVGEGNPLNTGYSDYASLGYYEISGTITNISSVPTITFSSPIDHEKINLSNLSTQQLIASIEADAGVKNVTFTVNGKSFDAQLDNNQYVVDWMPSTFGKFEIEAKITDNNDVVNTQKINIELVAPTFLQVVKIDGIGETICNDTIACNITLQNIGHQNVNSFQLDVLLDGKVIKSFSQTETFATNEIKIITLNDLPVNYSGKQEFSFIIKEINNSNVVANNVFNETITTDITHNGEIYTFSVNKNGQNVNMNFQVVQGSTELFSNNATSYSEDDGSNYNYTFCLAPDCYQIVTENILVDEGCTIQDWDVSKEYTGVGLQVMYNGLLYKGLSVVIPAGSNPVSSGYWYTLNETCPGTNGNLSYSIKDASNNTLHTVKVSDNNSGTIHEFCNNRPDVFVVYYDGNGNDDGIIPNNSKQYSLGDEVIIGSKESLKKTGYTFNGWNTKADGTGTTYSFATKFIITENVTLYAQWEDETVTNSFEETESHLVIYPNPIQNEVTIEADGMLSVSLITIDGQELFKTIISNDKVVLNTSSLAKGIYLLHIETSQGIVIKKIVKL